MRESTTCSQMNFRKLSKYSPNCLNSAVRFNSVLFAEIYRNTSKCSDPDENYIFGQHFSHPCEACGGLRMIQTLSGCCPKLCDGGIADVRGLANKDAIQQHNWLPQKAQTNPTKGPQRNPTKGQKDPTRDYHTGTDTKPGEVLTRPNWDSLCNLSCCRSRTYLFA